jgi:hypothetical protein
MRLLSGILQHKTGGLIMSKKSEYINRAYQNATAAVLSDVYKQPSDRKRYAFMYCQDLCAQFHGYNLRITAHTCQFFTAAFQFVNKDTGVIQIMNITASKNTIVDSE